MEEPEPKCNGCVDGPVLRLLKVSGLQVAATTPLDGIVIDRDALLRPDRYLDVAALIPDLKKHFSSTHLTALQSDSPSTQRWPLLNLVRQVLRASGFVMMPKRSSDGYDAGRQKRYKRSFVIRRARVK